MFISKSRVNLRNLKADSKSAEKFQTEFTIKLMNTIKFVFFAVQCNYFFFQSYNYHSLWLIIHIHIKPQGNQLWMIRGALEACNSNRYGLYFMYYLWY